MKDLKFSGNFNSIHDSSTLLTCAKLWCRPKLPFNWGKVEKLTQKYIDINLEGVVVNEFSIKKGVFP